MAANVVLEHDQAVIVPLVSLENGSVADAYLVTFILTILRCDAVSVRCRIRLDLVAMIVILERLV